MCAARHTRRSPVIPAKLVPDPDPDPDRGAGIHTAAHPSFPRKRESIPPHTRLSRESGNPYVPDVGLPLDKPKVHGKTGVVAKTKGPWLAGWARPAPATVRGAVLTKPFYCVIARRGRQNSLGSGFGGVRKPLFHGIALGRARRGRRGNQVQRIGIALDSGPTRFLRVCLAGPQVNPLSGHTGRITSHFAMMKTLRCCHPLAADCR